MPDTPTGNEIVAQHWPYDGPHTGDRTLAATEAVRQLVRYLANATRGAEGMPDPATANDVIVDLAWAASSLHQVLRQIEMHVGLLAPSTLYDDRDRPVGPTVEAANVALDEAQGAVLVLREHLNAAAQHLSHIGRKD